MRYKTALVFTLAMRKVFVKYAHRDYTKHFTYIWNSRALSWHVILWAQMNHSQNAWVNNPFLRNEISQDFLYDVSNQGEMTNWSLWISKFMKLTTNSAIYDDLLILCKIKEIPERDNSSVLIFFTIGTDEKSSFTNGALNVIRWNKVDVCLNVLIFHIQFSKRPMITLWLRAETLSLNRSKPQTIYETINSK